MGHFQDREPRAGLWGSSSLPTQVFPSKTTLCVESDSSSGMGEDESIPGRVFAWHKSAAEELFSKKRRIKSYVIITP